MELGQSFERLQLLEKKIAQIIDLLQVERDRSAKLLEEKTGLLERIEAMENSLLKETKSIEELSEERILTKQMVDELIQNIDHLVDSIPQSEVTGQ